MKELTPVFKLLRSQGFVAEQRYKCCSGCAGSAITAEFKAEADEDSTFAPKGFVFFHAQDEISEDEMRRSKWSAKPPSMMLRFGSVEYSGPDGKTLQTWGLPVGEIGTAVQQALEACGVAYEWDGDPDKCIEVFPFGKTKREGEPMQRTG